jgi:hypothetical protein
MPSISCRDNPALRDCDYFIRNPDPRTVQMLVFRHTSSTHADEVNKLFKQVVKGKAKFSEVVRARSAGMKWEGGDDVPKETTGRCGAMVAGCPDVVRAADFFAAFSGYFEHLEEKHPEILQEHLKNDFPEFSMKIVQSAEY